MIVAIQEAFPEEWAELHNNLGFVYQERIRGYEDRPHILNTILDLPVEESASHRGPGGRKTRLNPKDVNDMIYNIVRQSTPPQEPPASPPNNLQNETTSENKQS